MRAKPSTEPSGNLGAIHIRLGGSKRQLCALGWQDANCPSVTVPLDPWSGLVAGSGDVSPDGLCILCVLPKYVKYMALHMTLQWLCCGTERFKHSKEMDN